MIRSWLLVCFSALSLGALACEQGSQGDRCNPDLVDSTECGSGLSCVTPPTCVVSVCCPTSPPYSDPQCECIANPKACASSMSGGCNVDASYDTGAPVGDAGMSGKDAAHG